MIDYDPTHCTLCGSDEVVDVLRRDKRALTSDSRIVNGPLHKVACTVCGLIRNGEPWSSEALALHYGAHYELARQADRAEPLLFDGEIRRRRSDVIAASFASTLSEVGMTPTRVLELGCGEGNLMIALSRHWPKSAFFGIDPSEAAVEAASMRGLDVRLGTHEEIQGTYDLVVAFAVLEHVASPSAFLDRLRGSLSPGGLVATAQPTQDAQEGYDLFFTDHLHHFMPSHVGDFAAVSGMEQVVTRRLAEFPDFNLDVLLPSARRRPLLSGGAQAIELAQERVSRWSDVFDRVETFLLKARRRQVAVWGLGQTMALLQAYSALGEAEIFMGFDDNPARFPSAGFPVVRFGAAPAKRETAVLLTFAPDEHVVRRLEEAGVDYCAPLGLRTTR